FFQERVQPPERLQVRLLHHVRWVHAHAQRRIETQLDELPQIGPVPGEQLLEGLAVAALNALEQGLRPRRIGLNVSHRAVSYVTNSETARESTAGTGKKENPSALMGTPSL